MRVAARFLPAALITAITAAGAVLDSGGNLPSFLPEYATAEPDSSADWLASGPADPVETVEPVTDLRIRSDLPASNPDLPAHTGAVSIACAAALLLMYASAVHTGMSRVRAPACRYSRQGGGCPHVGQLTKVIRRC